MTLQTHPVPTEPASATSNRGGGGAKVSYAYSLDRQTFRGAYASRREAVEAGTAALEDWPTRAEAVWVGRRVELRPDVTELGRVVLDELERRRDGRGQAPRRPNGEAVADLDARLSREVSAWLVGHGLTPAPRVEEISEHPVPLVAHVGDVEGDEVELIGVEG